MPPVDPAQLNRLYQNALRRQSAGDLDGAAELLTQILAARPRQAEALFQMGRIAMARGAPKTAARNFAKAAEVKPAEPAIWTAYAEAVAAINDKAKAKAFIKKAKAARLAPRLLATLQDILAGARKAPVSPLGSAGPEHVQALLALANSGKPEAAETRAAELRKAHPDSAILADIHGNLLARLNRPDAAREAFETALRLAPDFVEARVNFGRFLVDAGDLAAGVSHLEAAVQMAPKHGPSLLALGTALARLGDTEGAIAILTRAAAALPKAPEPQVRLGEALLAAKDFGAAAVAFRKAIDLGDRRPRVHEDLARALDGSGQPEAALAAHDVAVAADPSRAEGHGRRAIQLQTLGRFDEAEAAFRRAIELDPHNGEAYRMLVKGRKLKDGDPLIAEMEALAARPDLTDHSRMNLAFALAKAMEDTGRTDRIFPFLHEANALMRKLYPFDIAERRAEIDRVKAAFDGVDYTRSVPGTTDYAPIFVTGMPRSGTTLVEQIIASHSRVTGGGELGFVAPTGLRMLDDGAGGLRALSDMADKDIAGFGRKVEAHFRMRLPGSDLVTDKSIQTYTVAGLVRLALPKARIVVVHRDPRDIGLSIYKNVFAEGTHRYAYNLRDLGQYYRLYLELIDFWRARLPDGFYEIAYEDLIAEPEAQSRALIAACGLEWEDACLDFHKTERRVSTLSLHQVRQPLYATSMKGWERHRDDLSDLIEALGDVID
ncbi:TPR repeat [Rhodovulum sp. P5]|uniref:tetratricopeptide repeat-containing sulfotransferase family protein n=1 Tax=Rhodovulum sp. P5 TaxID=1564506 RepID=UPI0009C1F2C0|nr:tetratricopeptide repeat-containing sulfotransferase family protein [Rhodovulum sp. P5]ARE41438.1 TPR repeat [Rhodovulum sp. P5]